MLRKNPEYNNQGIDISASGEAILTSEQMLPDEAPEDKKESQDQKKVEIEKAVKAGRLSGLKKIIKDYFVPGILEGGY